MATTVIPEQEFTERFVAAKRAAASDPVFINVADKPAYVFLSIDNYERLLRGDVTLFEAFSARRMGEAPADYEFSRLDDVLARPADLS